MKLERSEITILVVGLFAAFAIPFWATDLGIWWSVGLMALWLVIAVVCAGASAAGYGFFGGLSLRWLSFVQTFAAGAILMMLANTMIPEAYEHGGKLAGVFLVLGFAVCVWVIVLEHAGTG